MLKQSLVNPPVLSYPLFKHPFILDVDASGNGLGAVLSQRNLDKEEVIAYASRVLTKQERKYCTTRKELLALVWGVRYFKPYLYGRSFTAHTDHGSLTWLKSFKEPEGQLARWLQVLEQFDFEVIHRPGVQHLNADALSRGPCRQCGYESVCSTTAATDTSWLSDWSPDFLAQEQQKDPDFDWYSNNSMPHQFPKEHSQNIQSLWAQRHSLILQNNILCRKWYDVQNNGAQCLQVILPSHLRSVVLGQLHDHVASGAHFGQYKTIEKIQERFYWVSQRKDVQQWCERCSECAARKNPPRSRRTSMGTITAAYPFQVIALDILGPLPTTRKDNKYIVVIGDYFSKWTEAFPLTDMEAKTVATVLVDQFIC